jgi:hypothetical protein
MTPTEHLHDSQSYNMPLTDIVLDSCPTCEQPIPADRMGEVAGKIAARDSRRATELAARLNDQFAREQTAERLAAQRALEQARSEAANALENFRAEAALKETALREQLNRDAQIELQARLADADLTRIENENSLRQQLALAEETRTQLEAAGAAAAAMLAQVQAQAAEAETRIRAEVALEMDASARQQIAQLRDENTAALADMEEKHARIRKADLAALEASRTNLAELTQQSQALLTNAEAQHRARESQIQSTLEETRNRLTEVEELKRLADQSAQAANEAHAAEIARAVQETRESGEKDKLLAVQTEQSKSFEENQKLQTTVQDLQRQLERKTNQELGEGAEIDLFEDLKAEFPDDLITRVAKGSPGADIIHEVRQNGQSCGIIVYDSKNRNAWKNEYATKLRTDQIAAKADHAVLSSNRFPADTRQLHMIDHVIVACPARVVVLAQILRDHIVQTYQLRTSNEAREEKTAALYAFITSQRCLQLLDSVDSQITKLEEIDVAEHKAHTAVWERRGKAIKGIEKAHGDLRFEVNRIVGVTDMPGDAP